MIDAAALAARGLPHGTVVVAEEQTGGIGRHGHSWHSARGTGLYISIVLRLPAALPVLTLALGLAAQRAIDDLTGVTTDIRWPNDLMLNEKKLAGIMIQASESGAVIAGLGINVNQPEFPEDIRDVATSLRIETGREQDKDQILERIVAECLRYAAFSRTEILRQFEEHSTWVRGKAVEVEGKVRGVTAGLDEEGFLLVSTETGIERILAGGVRAL